MAGSYLPKRESELVTWAGNYTSRIQAAPTDYALTPEIAAELVALYDEFLLRYQTANHPDTRTKPAITAKNAKMAELIEKIRETARIVQAAPTVDDESRESLGLPVRKTDHTPIPRPSERPAVDLVSVVDRTVTVHVHDSESSTRRGKPAGAITAWVYTFIGDDYPADPGLWAFDGAVNKAQHEIVFPSTVAGGTKVWICAAWVNFKGEAGPTSVPISTNIQGGGSNPAEAGLKIAA